MSTDQQMTSAVNASGYEEFCQLWRTIRMNMHVYDYLLKRLTRVDRIFAFFIALSTTTAATSTIFSYIGNGTRGIILFSAACISIIRVIWPISRTLVQYQRLSLGYRDLDNQALRLHAEIKHHRKYDADMEKGFFKLIDKYNTLEMSQESYSPVGIKDILNECHSQAQQELTSEMLARGLDD
jgi:hypothetical protein